jgi:hypothetical protein
MEAPALSGGRFFMFQANVSHPLRSDVSLIEFDNEAVGLAVQDRGGFRFFAATPTLNRLDSQFFRSLKVLRRAIADVRRGVTQRASAAKPQLHIAA